MSSIQNDNHAPLIRTNLVQEIRPYLWNGFWVFDDENVGFLREPFVFGFPEILEEAMKSNNINIEQSMEGFRLAFSNHPFPGVQVEIVRLQLELGGNWYQTSHSGKKGWLCPGLYKYFAEAPERLYLACDLLK